MPRTSDSDDDNPLPQGSGASRGAQHPQGSESGSYRADKGAPSFLYSAEDPLPPSEVKPKTKRKKKKARATDVEDGMNSAPINEGQSFDMSQSFERSFESGVSAGRTEASKTSATPSRLSYHDSFTRIDENLAKAQVQGQEPNADDGEDENDAKKGGGKEVKKIKFPIKLGKIFRKNKKPETKDASVVETEMSAIPATLPSSGYLEPRSDTSSRYEMGGYAAATSYRVAQPHAGQRQMTTVSMLPAGEEEVCELERMLKEKQRKITHRKICESVFLSVVLVAGFVLGIILTAMSSLGLAFQIVGPTILGLSAFAIIGKIFVTVFWEEDPFTWTKGHVRKFTDGHRHKKNRKAEPAAETHTSLMPNPTYGGDENAPSPPPEEAMTSDFGDETNNQYGGGQHTPSFNFDSTFSQDA